MPWIVGAQNEAKIRDQVEKNQKSEKNSEVAGWVKPHLGIFCYYYYSIFIIIYLYVSQTKLYRGWVGIFCLDNPSFSRIFGFF